MNREMRRMAEREERRQKKQQKEAGGVGGRAAKAAQRRPEPAGEKRSLWKRLMDFLHEVRVEMRKVSWPTREQMIAFTTVTLITSVALTLLIFGFDVGMKESVLFVIGGSGG